MTSSQAPSRRFSTRPGTRHTLLGVALVTAVSMTAACGLPQGGQATKVPGDDVPYSLLARPTATPSVEPTPGVPVSPATIYLADAQQRLVAVPVQVTQAPLSPLLQGLLNRLAVGPSDEDRARGLATDLGPGTSLTLHEVSAGTATIELRTTGKDPSPGKLPVAIGQVVLTATAVVGVERVLFVLDGNPLSVPRPTSGDLTSAPLTATDYAGLLAPGQGLPARTAPLPGSPG